MRPALRRSVVIGLPVIFILAILGLSIVRLPDGTAGLMSWRGGGTPTLLAPGFTFRVPLLQTLERFPGGEVVVDATVGVVSRGGQTVSLPYRIGVRPTERELIALHREGGGDGVTAALRRWADQRLGAAAGRVGTHDLASGSVLPRLERFMQAGLAERFRQPARVAFGAPIVPQETLDAYEERANPGNRNATGIDIVLVGLDGADWDLIDPLIERGELPHFARLKRDGAWARMRSAVPTLSPLLWTTVATGKSPDRHGINDFLIADPRTGRRVPINSTFRRVKAIWNILSDGGLSCDVIAWWATWPAEPITGHLVSDRVAYSTFDLADEEARIGAVFPPVYAATVDRLRVAEEAIDHRQIARFLHIDAAEFRAARAAAERGRPPTEAQESINLMTRVLASTETYRRVAIDILNRRLSAGGLPRLFAVYFQGIDQVNHRFAHCAPPRESLCPAAEFRRFKDAVAEFYRYQDEVLGDFLNAAAGATVLVVSDHGFASGEHRPDDVKPFIEGRPGLWHDLVGIFAAIGPPIRAGEIASVSLYDVAPTVLYLLGLPVPEDMSGRAALAALTDRFKDAYPLRSVPSYEALVVAGQPPGTAATPGRGAAMRGAADEEILKQLRSLGYVSGEEAGPGASSIDRGIDRGIDREVQRGGTVAVEDAPGAAPAGGMPTLLYHTNLATVYAGKREFDAAEAEFHKALQIDPDAPQALTGLAVVYDLRGEPERALEILTRLVNQDEHAAPARLGKMAEIFIRIGRAVDGIAYMEGLSAGAVSGPRWDGGVGVALGMLYRAAGRDRSAEAVLKRALALEPDSLVAMQELFALYDASGRASELEPALRAALAIDPGLPMHHNWLGLVLKRRGDLEAAEQEFRETVELAPELAGVMANLGGLYLQQGRVTEALTILKQAVGEDPLNPEARTNLISAFGMEGNLAGARAEVEEAEATGQQIADYYIALGSALLYNDRPDEAMTAIRRALQIDPRRPAALRLRSEIEAAPERGRPAGGGAGQ